MDKFLIAAYLLLNIINYCAKVVDNYCFVGVHFSDYIYFSNHLTSSNRLYANFLYLIHFGSISDCLSNEVHPFCTRVFCDCNCHWSGSKLECRRKELNPNGLRPPTRTRPGSTSTTAWPDRKNFLFLKMETRSISDNHLAYLLFTVFR